MKFVQGSYILSNFEWWRSKGDTKTPGDLTRHGKEVRKTDVEKYVVYYKDRVMDTRCMQ